MAIYVTDTHPLLWYSTRTYRKLSPKVQRLFDRASRGEVLIWLPAMAIWEAALLEKIGRIRFDRSFSYWLGGLLAQPGFAFAPLDQNLIASNLEIIPNSDLFDAGIVATARYKEAPLITRDGAITNSKAVEVFW